MKEIVSKLCDADLNKGLKRTLTNISEDFHEDDCSGEQDEVFCNGKPDNVREKEKFFLPGNKQDRKTSVTFEKS